MSDLESRIERGRQRLASLRACAEREERGSRSTLGEALEELSITIEDLSSANDALAALRIASEQHLQRYRDLVRFAPDGYVITDEHGVIRQANRAAEQQLGSSARSLEGRPLLALVAPVDREAFLGYLSAIREERARIESRSLRFGSEPGFDASVSAVPEPRDDGLEIRWTIRDLSELRERDAFRDEIERHLEPILWLYQLDPPRSLHVSGVYEKIWGRPLSWLYADPRDWLEQVHPEDQGRVEAAFVRLLEGEPFDAEYRILRPDGELRWVRGRGRALTDDRGRLNRAAGIAEDVTERKTAEAALARAERRRRAAAVASERTDARERRALARDLHDTVSQSLALARAKLIALRDAGEEAERVTLAGEIESLVAEADEWTRTLTFRLSPPVLHDLGLAAATEWLAEDLERRFGLQVVVTDCGMPSDLDFETREALFRSLRELLINVARHARADEAKVRLALEAENVEIRVSDGGIGFDPSCAAEGFGLLSIRERLDALGGRLDMESEPGGGTRARLIAPASREG